MRKAHTILFVAALLLSPNAAYAWGFEGHQIVALIAAGELTPAAKARVADLLGEPNATAAMERYSTWADEIRPVRPEAAQWHYVDIEMDSNGYNAARDCQHDDCVVGQITRDTAILKNRSLAKPVRAEALRFLIHFVGDEHQPLHCSDNYDRGGNEVRVILNGTRTNLHAVWDRTVVEALGDRSATVAAKLSAQITPAERAAWSSGTPVSWANECWGVAKQVYAGLRGKGGTSRRLILPPAYARANAAIAAKQLQRAGVRLAAILNAVFK